MYRYIYIYYMIAYIYIYIYIMTDMIQVTTANKWEIIYELSNCIFSFILGSLLMIKVKIIYISTTEYLVNGDR